MNTLAPALIITAVCFATLCIDNPGMAADQTPRVPAIANVDKVVPARKTSAMRAKEAEAERQQKARAQTVADIATLSARKEVSASQAAAFAGFIVTKARFSIPPPSYGRPKPLIELEVKNQSPSPISRVYFEGVLSKPKRSIPWLREPFDYPVPGGLEPGETATWKISPNPFGPWGTVDAPGDVELTVKASKIEGVNGQELFADRVFSEQDQQRLEQLTKDLQGMPDLAAR